MKCLAVKVKIISLGYVTLLAEAVNKNSQREEVHSGMTVKATQDFGDWTEKVSRRGDCKENCPAKGLERQTPDRIQRITTGRRDCERRRTQR